MFTQRKGGKMWVEICALPPVLGPQAWPFTALVGIVTPAFDRTTEHVSLENCLGDLAGSGVILKVVDLVVALEHNAGAAGFWQVVLESGWEYLFLQRAYMKYLGDEYDPISG